jgi:lipopolysaccharide/colanic/teichoic acid biosynthesis glycosyltransferase
MIYPEIHQLTFRKTLLRNRLLNHEYLIVVSGSHEDNLLFNSLNKELKARATKIYYTEFISFLKEDKFSFKVLLISNSCIFDSDINQTLFDLKINNKEVYSLNSFVEHFHKKISLSQASTNYFFKNSIINVRINRHYLLTKRFFDIFICLIILPFSIILVLTALLGIILTSKGNPFFFQERIGRNGKIFSIYKLRTMRITNNKDKSFTVENDSRIYPLGRYLRILKIDELPQIINILKGEMSLIGPRPERADIVNEILIEYPIFNLRHLIVPGITGWAQVNLPKATPNDNLKKLEFDLYYIKNQSYFLDFKIIIKTIKVIVSRNSN